MPRPHLVCTPESPMHRTNSALRLEVGNLMADGEVDPSTGAMGAKLMLLPQPWRQNKYRGVSLFVPQCSQAIFDMAHSTLSGGVNSCIVSVPNTPLPEGLLLVNDHTFSLRLSGSRERTLIGQHYTLFTPTEMSVDDFNERYLRLISAFVPCTMKASGAASLASLTDPHVMPADEQSTVAVMALEQLAATTSDPETQFFATLFALDMRACKTVFEDVVQGCHKRVAMVAAALDEFVARDPMVREAVMDAQEALEVALPGYKPLGCKYEPSWVSMQ